jgi:hypothetical protein
VDALNAGFLILGKEYVQHVEGTTMKNFKITKIDSKIRTIFTYKAK